MKIRTRNSSGDERILEIESIQRLDLGPGEKLVIQVDIGTMPPMRAKQYMEDIRHYFGAQFSKNTIIVVPSTMTLSVMP